jgi:hypothetical protein
LFVKLLTVLPFSLSSLFLVLISFISNKHYILNICLTSDVCVLTDHFVQSAPSDVDVDHNVMIRNYYVSFTTALQPFVGPWQIFSFLILCTVGKTPWTGDQPVARPLSAHRITQIQNKRTQYRHPCLQWDSNPRSQRSSERRHFLP